jgi:hypothetical protein
MFGETDASPGEGTGGTSGAREVPDHGALAEVGRGRRGTVWVRPVFVGRGAAREGVESGGEDVVESGDAGHDMAEEQRLVELNVAALEMSSEVCGDRLGRGTRAG